MRRLLNLLLGKRLATSDEEEHKVGVWEGVPMLGLDALGSSAYGPEAALTILLPLGIHGLRFIGPLTLVILVLLAILYFSYRQIIGAYPNGGGAYTVARQNLGTGAGLLAAAALALDYLLNVAVGVAAGIGALVSVFPGLHPHILVLCLGTLVVITLVNLRGARESGMAWALPTYLFLASLLGVLGVGIGKTLLAHGHPSPVVPPPSSASLSATASGVSLWLLLRAFSSGCTAMTGVEAVSNGVTAFAAPAVKRARQTLTVLVIALGLLLVGVAYLAGSYHILAMSQEKAGYQSVISQLVAAVVGRGPLYYVVLASVLAVLCLSANTSFAGFPRLCRLLAEDDFLPNAFADKGRRLVFTTGIVVLAVLSGGILIVFGGITDRLIPLFAVGAFGAFTLSQAGMVAHWRKVLRAQGEVGEGKSDGEHNPDKASPAKVRASLVINALGCVATAGTLLVVLAAKFTQGAWVTLLLIAAMVLLFRGVKRHYVRVARETRCPRPLAIKGDEMPLLVVVPISGWTTVTEKALRFAMALSDDVTAVHIAADTDEEKTVRNDWERYVVQPLTEAKRTVPQLRIIASPYRRVFGPFLRFIRRQETENPSRQIAVVIPELIEARWWHYPLHNQRAAALKAALFFGGDSRTVIMNVPWYLGQEKKTQGG